jgi:Tfp pilus assembly protein PilF
MFTIDERLRGLPAVKEQVVVLYQSLNSPHLAIPGRKAGPASASVLGLRGPTGFAVFVYLYMPQSGESAVYVPSNGAVPADRFASEEAEALGFVESMGFLMDNLNFPARPPDEQDAIIRTAPVFMREPPPAQQPGTTPAQAGQHAQQQRQQASTAAALARVFSAFCLAAVVISCAHVSERDREQAQLHYDLGVQNLVKAPQVAIKEAEQALKLDPRNADAWHLKALVLHQSFQRLEEAQQAYLKALELKKPFPEANTNLGGVYMDMKRYDDAIAQYKEALDDVTYREPYLPQGNLGWAYFKKGDVKLAIDYLRGATSVNPRFCLGHLWLGQVHESQGSATEACRSFAKYRESCPDRADAWQRDAVCLVNAGDLEGATKAFDACIEKAAVDEQKELCRGLKAQLSAR